MWETRDVSVSLPDGTVSKRKETVWKPTPKCFERKMEFLPWSPEFIRFVEEEKLTVHNWCQSLSETAPVIPKKSDSPEEHIP